MNGIDLLLAYLLRPAVKKVSKPYIYKRPPMEYL